MRYTESNCVGCETCRCCGRNIEKAFFCCDKCDTIVAGDIEIRSDDDYEESWLNEAPNGSGQMWCDDCVKSYKDNEREERWGNDCFTNVEIIMHRANDEYAYFDCNKTAENKWFFHFMVRIDGVVFGAYAENYDYLLAMESFNEQLEKLLKKTKEKSA